MLTTLAAILTHIELTPGTLFSNTLAIISHFAISTLKMHNNSIFSHALHSSYVTQPKSRGARDRTRTGDLSLTKEVLYQLSYVGN